MTVFGISIDSAILIGNLFSLLAATCDCLSTFSKKKQNMIAMQQGFVVFNATANFMLGGYSGMIINILEFFRNALVIRDKYSKKWMIIMTSLLIAGGLLINNRGWIGLIAVAASAQYTICLFYMKDAQQMRYALLVNTLMWFTYDFMILSIPMAVMDLIIAVFSLVNIIRYRNAS